MSELDEEQELDMWGCEAMGVMGCHSDSYGDDGDGACDWCGATPPTKETTA